MASNPTRAVVVVHPFGLYKKGQIITDPTEIADILNGEQRAFVVSTDVPVQKTSAPQTLEGE